MKKKARKALGFVFLATVLFVAFLIVTLNRLVHQNLDQIQAELQRRLGRNVTFQGVALDLWGGLGLSAADLRIADDPRFAATPLVQTKEIRMEVRWLPLLWGRVEVRDFTLGEPEIQIIKNEAGQLNILAALRPAQLKTEDAPGQGAKRPTLMTFPLSRLKVTGGSIHYIDRSTKEPVEVRLYNVDLDLFAGRIPHAVDINLAANFLNGKEQNFRLSGRVGPLGTPADWSHSPVDLKMAVKGLPVPKLITAIPILREKVPSYLDVSGPLSMETRVVGILGKPRMTGLTLTGAFFGSPSNNVTLAADLDMSRGLGEPPSVEAKITVESVFLEHLKGLPLLQRILPPSLAGKGPLVLAGEVHGTSQEFEAYASVDAKGSEIAYGQWIKKPEGTPAKVEIRATRTKDGISLNKSTVTIGNLSLGLSGLLEEKPERLLRLRVYADSLDIAGWDTFLPPAAPYHAAGKIRMDLSIQKIFSIPEADWNLQGFLTLDDLSLRKKGSQRAVEGITAQIAFLGHEARVNPLQFRVGGSEFTFEADLKGVAEPTVRYRLKSPKVNLVDFTARPTHKTDWIRGLESEGSLTFTSSAARLDARLHIAEGRARELPYQNLKSEIVWSPHRLNVKEFAFEALDASFKGRGVWQWGNGAGLRFTFAPKVEGVDLKELLPRVFPAFPDGFEGKLDFDADLEGGGENWETIQKSLEGHGRAKVESGMLKDVNLVYQVLSRVTGLPGVGDLIPSSLPPRYEAFFKKRHTAFDTLKAAFRIQGGRFQAEDLVLAAADYSIRGKGWIGFDRTIVWKGKLFLSQRLTQQLERSRENIRYLVNDQGRLEIPFQLTGSLAQVEPKPDIEQLSGLIQQGLNGASEEQGERAGKPRGK